MNPIFCLSKNQFKVDCFNLSYLIYQIILRKLLNSVILSGIFSYGHFQSSFFSQDQSWMLMVIFFWLKERQIFFCVTFVCFKNPLWFVVVWFAENTRGIFLYFEKFSLGHDVEFWFPVRRMFGTTVQNSLIFITLKYF